MNFYKNFTTPLNLTEEHLYVQLLYENFVVWYTKGEAQTTDFQYFDGTNCCHDLVWKPLPIECGQKFKITGQLNPFYFEPYAKTPKKKEPKEEGRLHDFIQ